MTGYRSQFLRHRCVERGCYIDQLPDWDDLIECFPRRIRPTDVDGMVEINDHLLFIEEKCAGKGPDEGQRQALRALSTRPRITTVFIRPGSDSELEVLTFGLEHPPNGWQKVSREWFRTWLRAWVANAERVAA